MTAGAARPRAAERRVSQYWPLRRQARIIQGEESPAGSGGEMVDLVGTRHGQLVVEASNDACGERLGRTEVRQFHP